jgi:hypothetical protein
MTPMPGPRLPFTEVIIAETLDDAAIPGVIVEVDPEEADDLGAFREDAVDDAAAWDANADL